jgi:hypothetical protein
VYGEREFVTAGGPHVLRRQPGRHVPRRRQLRRQDPEGRQAS